MLAWLGLAAVKRITEDLDGAFADLERAQPAAERHCLTEQRARIHFLRGNLHFPRGNIEGCLVEHAKSLQLAREIGVRISIGSDAHATDQLTALDYGIAAARLADIPEERIVNCMSADALIDWTRSQRRSQPLRDERERSRE